MEEREMGSCLMGTVSITGSEKVLEMHGGNGRTRM